jgi:hypothetical protein
MEDKATKKERKEQEKKQLRDEYLKLKSKYSLPDYDSLDKDFEIGEIDPDENILREILKEMHEQIDFYSRLLENLIQPDSKLSDMKEAGNFTQEDQDLILELYRKCMLMNRTLLLTNLEYNDDEAAKNIIHMHKEWQDIKKDLKHILTKMRDTWKQDTKKETHGGYYG